MEHDETRHGWLCGYHGERLRPATEVEAGRSARSTVVDRHRGLITVGEWSPASSTDADLGYVSPFAILAEELAGRPCSGGLATSRRIEP